MIGQRKPERINKEYGQNAKYGRHEMRQQHDKSALPEVMNVKLRKCHAQSNSNVGVVNGKELEFKDRIRENAPHWNCGDRIYQGKISSLLSNVIHDSNEGRRRQRKRRTGFLDKRWA